MGSWTDAAQSSTARISLDETEWAELRIYAVPAPSGWQAHVLPGFIWEPSKGQVPNAFHRFMQRLCFGVRWERVDRGETSSN